MRARKIQLRNKRKRREEESDEEFVLGKDKGIMRNHMNQRDEESDEEFVMGRDRSAKRSNVKRPIDQGVGSVSKRRGRLSVVCLRVREWSGIVWKELTVIIESSLSSQFTVPWNTPCETSLNQPVFYQVEDWDGSDV